MNNPHPILRKFHVAFSPIFSFIISIFFFPVSTVQFSQSGIVSSAFCQFLTAASTNVLPRFCSFFWPFSYISDLFLQFPLPCSHFFLPYSHFFLPYFLPLLLPLSLLRIIRSSGLHYQYKHFHHQYPYYYYPHYQCYVSVMIT